MSFTENLLVYSTVAAIVCYAVVSIIGLLRRKKK